MTIYDKFDLEAKQYIRFFYLTIGCIIACPLIQWFLTPYIDYSLALLLWSILVLVAVGCALKTINRCNCPGCNSHIGLPLRNNSLREAWAFFWRTEFPRHYKYCPYCGVKFDSEMPPPDGGASA
jgi:hypothetical protein